MNRSGVWVILFLIPALALRGIVPCVALLYILSFVQHGDAVEKCDQATGEQTATDAALISKNWV